MLAPSGTDNPESMLDELINKFIDKFVLPLPLFIFYLPYIAAKGVRVRLATRVWFHKRHTNLIQQRRSEINDELPAPAAEPDDDQTP
jgi:hypothetical protein